MQKIAVIGAGVSGLTTARLLAARADVTVYEADSRPGGLIKCDRVEGSLFHTCGGHVFNTRRPEVLDLFWSIFDRDKEFMKADRNSAVIMPDGKEIPYPIENHAYMLDDDTLKRVIADVTAMRANTGTPGNFEEFLRKQFGDTLYDIYFQPYNRKIWRRDLSAVPLSWLEGKLPMPTPEEIIYNNIRRVKEKAFVHSTFYYEKQNGSQHLADRLAEGADVRYDTPVTELRRMPDGRWTVNGGADLYDRVV
ncbi:MAG: FAD-dependent oxidoreductase, partial [Duncaniella sp.]|nr:FAD-dependent oxidoreductase [Duncaniella sp.]